jgi:DNA end-binding protein Ku
MRAIWKGTISFGLVNIPIALGLATGRSDPSFRTLDRESLQPVKQQLFSPSREEVVSRDDTIKGFEVSKDRYLAITDEELESVSVQRRRTIDILAFVDAAEIDPVYYDRTYYLDPQEHAAKPYSLLLRAMRDAGKAALGKIVLSSKEHLVLLRPSGDALVVELLFYPEDVRSKAEIEERVRDTEIRDEELAMAEQLIESLARPFDPKAYENEHKRLVLELVERKLAGEEVPVAVEEPAAAPVPDLMAALKASIEQAKAAAPAAEVEAAEPAPAPKRGGKDSGSSTKAGASSGGKARGSKAKGAAKNGSRSKSGSKSG